LTRLLGNSQVVFTLASSWLQVIATKHQFLEITNELLSHHKVEGDVANIIANAVWNKSRDIRDCVRIGKLARSDKINQLTNKRDFYEINYLRMYEIDPQYTNLTRDKWFL
jgi:hypothetical protein